MADVETDVEATSVLVEGTEDVVDTSDVEAVDVSVAVEVVTVEEEVPSDVLL